MENKDNKELKKKIADFYYKLSVLRKNKTKPSRSMTYIIHDSDRIMEDFVTPLNLKDKSIADIGGSVGSFLFSHSDKFNKNSKVSLIDISAHHVNLAKKTYKSDFNNKFKFETLASDVDDLKFKEKFDVIFFRSILEHLYFPETSIENLSRALKKSGLLLIITPNRNRLNERIKRLLPKKLRYNLKLKYGTDVPDVLHLEKETGLIEHIHEYTFKEIKILLNKHNLDILKVKYSTSPFIVPSLCDKYPIMFNIQKAIISFLNFMGLNRFWGFDFVILARKRTN